MCGGGKIAPRRLSAMEPSQEVGEPFHCAICMDLVYKPIVQSCGHMFCFWCAHRAMNANRKSQCPVCRHPYIHFRRVCEMLHFFLMRVEPEEYSRRARETHDMEQSNNVFSPRIQESPRSIESPRKEAKQPFDRSPTSPGRADYVQRQAFVDSVADASWMRCGCGSNAEICREGTCPEHIREEVEDDKQPKEHQDEDGCDSELSVEHFACAACNKFLYRPVVLSCGQVFCEFCVKGSSPSASCPSCRNPHPEGPVQVCLELHEYLERAFTAEYTKRKEEVLSQQTKIERQSDAEDVSSEQEEAADLHFVHVRVGCDGCGMYPIMGDWYHCEDCSERIGYDLCGGCQRKGNAIAGRFNQQHGPEHYMVLKNPESRASADIVTLNLSSGTIQRRRQQQILFDGFDEFLDSFM